MGLYLRCGEWIPVRERGRLRQGGAVARAEDGHRRGEDEALDAEPAARLERLDGAPCVDAVELLRVLDARLRTAESREVDDDGRAIGFERGEEGIEVGDVDTRPLGGDDLVMALELGDDVSAEEALATRDVNARHQTRATAAFLRNHASV